MNDQNVAESIQVFENRSCGYLAHDRLLAGAATALLSRVDTLAAHVGLEVA